MRFSNKILQRKIQVSLIRNMLSKNGILILQAYLLVTLSRIFLSNADIL